MISTFLYEAEGKDREIELSADAPRELAEHHILWVDACDPDAAELARLKAAFALSPQCTAGLMRPRTTFTLDNYGDYFHCDVPAVMRQPKAQGGLPRTAAPARLDFIVAPQWLITVHAAAIDFLQQFRDQDKGETMIGALTGPQVAASLLDWHLEAYLGALEDVESFVEGLDVRILARTRVREALLGEVVLGRRYVSSLRRMLSPQRSVFYGFSRPDFSKVVGEQAEGHFGALERRFERTLDAIEHGRELMQSSFDLFTTRTAETTNMLLRRLTFLSVMLGAMAAIAGLLGMNFPPPFAKVGDKGFWIVVCAMAALTIGGVVIARLRKWI